MLMSKLFHIFGLFMVAQSGLRMATDGPGSWQEWEKEEWSPSSLLPKQCCSVAILSPCQASKVKAFSQKARAYSVLWEGVDSVQCTDSLITILGWAQDSSPRIQKHEERLKRRKNILELSHLIENFICNCFIACHCSDSSGTGLITSENTTIDCC